MKNRLKTLLEIGRINRSLTIARRTARTWKEYVKLMA